MSGPVDGAPPPSLGGPVERRGRGLFHRHHDEDDPGAWCSQCGGEFRSGTTWCDDCGVPLSSARPLAEDRVVDRHDVVEYDLREWSDEQVAAIDGLDEVADDVQYEFEEWTPQQCQQLVDRLLELGIACRWDGYLLGVADADEATVDAEVLEIDPTFPVNDAGDLEVQREEPDLGIPEGPWWSKSAGEMAVDFLGLQRDP